MPSPVLYQRANPSFVDCAQASARWENARTKIMNNHNKFIKVEAWKISTATNFVFFRVQSVKDCQIQSIVVIDAGATFERIKGFAKRRINCVHCWASKATFAAIIRPLRKDESRLRRAVELCIEPGLVWRSVSENPRARNYTLMWLGRAYFK